MFYKTVFFALSIAFGFFFFAGCSEGQEQKQELLQVDLEDAVVQQIYNFKNKRQVSVLLPYLAVENPMYRLVAAQALASLPDSSALPHLANLLRNDNSVQIREAAAFALGQLGSREAANYLVDAFQLDSQRRVQAAILEAVGRCGTEEHLKYLCVAPPYPLKDSLLVEAQAMALLRFALRGMVHNEGTAKIMNDFLANSLISSKVRFIAANYLTALSIEQAQELLKYESVLLSNLANEEDINSQMFLVFGLAKTKSNKALEALKELYKKPGIDYRLRCNIIKAWQYFPYDSLRSELFAALNDSSSLAIQRTAADYLYNYGNEWDAYSYAEQARKQSNGLLRARLYAAALKHYAAYQVPMKQALSYEIMREYKKDSLLVYEQGELLKSLAEYPLNYRFIARELFPLGDSTEVALLIRSKGTEALANIRRSPNLMRDLGFNALQSKEELNALLRQAMETGDPGLIGIVCGLFLDEKIQLSKDFPDPAFLFELQKRLALPQAMESYWLLQRCIDLYFPEKAKTFSAYEQAKGNYADIDWAFINALGKRPQLQVRSSKGNFRIELYPELAPATVQQIVQLAKAGFYDKKTLHRVVPNFVIQGGCPRGDGWGGIRIGLVSELSAKSYDREGFIGMAHGGRDTEGSQFFINLSPTLQLDGNYTLFGAVVEGMQVVHELEVGDELLSVELL